MGREHLMKCGHSISRFKFRNAFAYGMNSPGNIIALI
jgi:hypothetical protein